MKTKLMGIMNLTTDSFSGDGLFTQNDFLKATWEQAESMLTSGASILDLGAESSRPGAAEITSEMEWNRIAPVLEELKSLNTIISIDTYHAKTAELALNNGANWINSIWGFQKDARLLSVIREARCPIIIMHNSSDQAVLKQDNLNSSFYQESIHQNVTPEIIFDLEKQIESALNQGISASQIIIDPGIGFGKTPSQNLEIIKNLATFKKMGFPLLLGASRKSFIGVVLNLPIDQRLEGTLAVCTLAVSQGIEILRVHDVEAVARVTKITEAINNA